MVLAEQQGVRSQTQYKQEYLGSLYTADTLYGTAVLRDDAAFNLMVKAHNVTRGFLRESPFLSFTGYTPFYT